jgi:hypothetical protein
MSLFWRVADMAKIETQATEFSSISRSIKILQKHDINFELEKESTLFVMKIEVNEDFTLQFQTANKILLREIFSDFFALTELYQFTSEIDWTQNIFKIQFII